MNHPITSHGTAEASTGHQVLLAAGGTPVPIERLRADGGTQLRAGGLNSAYVDRLADLYRAGTILPAVEAIDDGTELWLWDGHHRLAAARAAGLKEIACRLEAGTRRMALRKALGANGRHGLRRTHEDLRASLKLALLDPEWGTLSNAALAEICECGETSVRTIRAELVEAKEVPQVTERRGLDGKVRSTKAAAPEESDAGTSSSPGQLSLGNELPPILDALGEQDIDEELGLRRGKLRYAGQVLEVTWLHPEGVWYCEANAKIFGERENIAHHVRELHGLVEDGLLTPPPRALKTLGQGWPIQVVWIAQAKEQNKDSFTSALRTWLEGDLGRWLSHLAPQDRDGVQGGLLVLLGKPKHAKAEALSNLRLPASAWLPAKSRVQSLLDQAADTGNAQRLWAWQQAHEVLESVSDWPGAPHLDQRMQRLAEDLGRVVEVGEVQLTLKVKTSDWPRGVQVYQGKEIVLSLSDLTEDDDAPALTDQQVLAAAAEAAQQRATERDQQKAKREKEAKKHNPETLLRQEIKENQPQLIEKAVIRVLSGKDIGHFYWRGKTYPPAASDAQQKTVLAHLNKHLRGVPVLDHPPGLDPLRKALLHGVTISAVKGADTLSPEQVFAEFLRQLREHYPSEHAGDWGVDLDKVKTVVAEALALIAPAKKPAVAIAAKAAPLKAGAKKTAEKKPKAKKDEQDESEVDGGDDAA